jgi:predicted nucleic acid-binding protein
MKLLLDLNVLLDIFLKRAPWYTDAAAIWQAHLDGRVRAFVAAFSLATLYYVVRRNTDRTTARAAVSACLATLDIVPVDHSTLVLAQAQSGPDFEDNLQLACALQIAADALVTRDPSGFPNAPLPVWSPADLVARLPPVTGTP